MKIRGNEPLLLNDPETIWVIESGSLALFAIKVRNGIAEGERRYLYNVYPGEALFGILPSGESEQYGIVAIALEPTELTVLHPSDVSCSKLMDCWIDKLSQVEGLPQPKLSGLVTQTQYIALMKGQIYQPQANQIVWAQIQQGKAYWLGYPELTLDAETGLFPLASLMWLEAEDHLELFIQSTIEIEDIQMSLRGLAQLHVCFLRCVQLIATAENQAALRRFQDRQTLNQQVTQSTIRNLVTILSPGDRNLDAETPLLMAAGAVGKALGVKIQPPMQSEDLNRVKEPLEAIARASRLRLRRVLLRDRWWQKDGGAILAYTRSDHQPVALLPVAGDRYELYNPALDSQPSDVKDMNGNPDFSLHRPVARRIPINEKVAATLDPVAYVFYRPLPDGMIKAWDLARFVLQGRQRDLFTILLTGVAATLLGMLIPQATAILIDDAIPYGNSSLLIQIGLGLLAAAFGSASFQLAQAIASMRIETLSDASLQAAVWDRLLKLQTAFFRQYSIGDLNSRVSGISAIRRKLSGTVLQTVFASFFSLLNLGLLFYYSPQLATLALVVALIIMTFTVVSGIFLIQKHQPLTELEGEIFGIMVQLINGVPKLRIAGGEERAFAYWGQKYTRQLQLTLSTQRLEDVVVLFNTVMPTLTTVALFWLASTLINPAQMFDAATLSAGKFLAFNVAFGTFIGGATSLSNTVVEVLDVIPTWRRSQPILTAQPEVSLNKTDPGRLSGSIHIDHVTFRYRDDGPLILDDVTIRAKPGEFIALVGPSGSGKSTIMRLMLGFETPISGTVYYDGQDLMGLDVSAVRRQLGVVLQNSRINAGSIFENIASGALISLDDAWTAAEMSGLADDIQAMPMQMHTLISEGGTNLSGGQRQRLIIARALALHPRILLFDEATSALDNRTQAIVSRSLDQLKVTRVVIAHRLSTIRNADCIYVLESGRVVQQGSFETLSTQPGLFAQLISRQVV
jgi:NHLM bacteriocin system ABC transporter ATP-binding protein